MSIASLSNAQWLNINVNTVIASEVTANDIAADNLLVSGGVSFQGDIAFSNMQNPWPTQGNSGQILTSNGQGDLYWSNGGGSGGGSVSQIETNTPNTVTITNPNGPIVTIDVTGTGGGSITQLTTNTPDTVTITNPDGPIVTIDVTGSGSAGVSQLTSTDPNIHLSSATGDVSIAINPQLTIEELYVNPTTTTNILSVSNGGVLLEGDVIVNGYSLPSINGNAGEVLSSNSNGTCTWIPMGGGSGSITQISSANNLISVSNPTGPNVTITASQDPSLTGITVNSAGNEVIVNNSGIGLAGNVTINGYMMPGTNGQNGQFLSSNTNGVAQWENITSGDSNIVISQGTELSLAPTITVDIIDAQQISINNPADTTLMAITSDTCSVTVSSQTSGNESIILLVSDSANNTSSKITDTYMSTPQLNIQLSPTSGYTLPITAGNTNQVLTLGNNGVCTWTTVGGGTSGLQGVSSASPQITVSEANNIATLTYDGITGVSSQTPNITVTNVAQNYEINMPATVNFSHAVIETLTIDTGTESYQLPTTMPTTGQILGYNGTNLVWETAPSGGNTIVGSSNIGINTVGNTSTISLNPNISVTGIDIANYKMPSAAGTIDQVLNLGPSNEIIWRTLALDDIQGSQNIDVSIAGYLATVSLNPDLNISSLQIGNYNMPTTAGTTGQILALNASNDVTWVNPPTGSGSIQGSLNVDVNTVGNVSTISLPPEIELQSGSLTVTSNQTDVMITQGQIIMAVNTQNSYSLPQVRGTLGQTLILSDSNGTVSWGSPGATFNVSGDVFYLIETTQQYQLIRSGVPVHISVVSNIVTISISCNQSTGIGALVGPSQSASAIFVRITDLNQIFLPPINTTILCEQIPIFSKLTASGAFQNAFDVNTFVELDEGGQFLDIFMFPMRGFNDTSIPGFSGANTYYPGSFQVSGATGPMRFDVNYIKLSFDKSVQAA